MNKRVRKDSEVVCEYVLPDYMGDIKKILASRARAIPAGRFVGEGEVSVSGVVEYEVLYADSENKLTSITASADYGVSVPTSSSEEGCAVEESHVESLGIRITGPRKIIMKSNVATVIAVSEDLESEVTGDGFSEPSEVITRTTTISVENSVFGNSGEREYSEEAERLVGVAVEGVEIISTGGRVRITEAESTDGGVIVRGEIIITSIVRTEEQPPFAIRRVIPFEEKVEIEGVTEGMQAVADGYVTSAVCSTSADGEDTVLLVNAILEYTAAAYKNSDVEVVTDAYLQSALTEEKYTYTDYKTLLEVGEWELAVGTERARESLGCSDVRDILFVNAEVKSSEAVLGGCGAEISGEILVCGVACEVNADNSINYVPIKFSFPFSSSVNFNCQIPDGAQLDLRTYVSDAEGKLDGDNIYVKCLLKARSHVVCGKKIKRLEELIKKEDALSIPTASRITVYYPKTGDTLFDVAKYFHTTEEKLARDNGLTELTSLGSDKALYDVKKLIIR